MFERFVIESTAIRIAYLTPIISFFGFIGATREKIGLVAVMVAGAVLSNLYLSQRDYNITILEALLYLFLLLWVYSGIIWGPRLAARLSSKFFQGFAILALAGVGVALLSYVPGINSLLRLLERNTHHQRELSRINDGIPGKSLWIVPDNNYRPLSVESSIMKGGSGARGQWMHPDSPLMRRLFPNLEFKFYREDLSRITFNNFDKIFFTYASNIASTRSILQHEHKLDLTGWSCRGAVKFEPHGIAICVPPHRSLQ
jgi:hypothetical protein